MTEVAFAKSFLTTLDSKATKYQPDHVFDSATVGTRTPFALPKLPHPQHPLPPKQNDLSTAPLPGSEPATVSTNTVNITLKSSRNPSMSLSLPSTPPSTTIASLKQQVQTYLGGSTVVASTDKIKILYNKKPIPASKQTIGEVLGTDGTKDLELGVMVMGGAPDPPSQASPPTAFTERIPEAAGPGSENAAVEARTGLNPADAPASSTAMEGITLTPEKSRSESHSQPVQPGESSGEDLLESAEFWSDLEGFLSQRLRSQEDAARLKTVFERAWRSGKAAP